MSAATTTSPLTEPVHDDIDADAPRRRGRRPVVLLVLLLAVAGAVWFLFLRGGGGQEPAGEPEEGMVVEVAQMTVNLAGDELHYLRFAFALVLAEDVVPAEVEPRYPLLKDAALSVAQAFTQEELRTPEGTARLRAELGARAQEIYPDGPVLRVVLTELLVQ